MWKLRKNVPFRILRKYGFEYNNSSKWWERKIDGRWYDLICIDKDGEVFEMTEQIGYWDATFSDKEWFNEECIKDLIQDSLLEWEV